MSEVLPWVAVSILAATLLTIELRRSSSRKKRPSALKLGFRLGEKDAEVSATVTDHDPVTPPHARVATGHDAPGEGGKANH